MTSAITPDEAADLKIATIPDWVVEVFNEAIAARFDGHSASFTQDHIVGQLMTVASLRMEGITEDQLFREHWLDVEALYRKAGWVVVYDKPGYCESYHATFTFKKKS